MNSNIIVPLYRSQLQPMMFWKHVISTIVKFTERKMFEKILLWVV